MQLKITATSITEPITASEVKSFMGYTATDQDTLIGMMITAARKWFEDRTGLSVVAKEYKAYFEKQDSDDSWFELPVAPILASPVITCKVNGVSTTFQQKGLTKVSICPDNVIGTVGVGATSTPWYLEVTFTAGETSEEANVCLLSIVSSIFKDREAGTSVNTARLPFDTAQRVNSMIVY